MFETTFLRASFEMDIWWCSGAGLCFVCFFDLLFLRLNIPQRSSMGGGGVGW